MKLPRFPHTLYSIPLNYPSIWHPSISCPSIWHLSIPYPSIPLYGIYLSIYGTCLTIVQYRYNMENSAIGLLIACFVRLSPHAHQHPLSMKLKSPVPGCEAFPFPRLSDHLDGIGGLSYRSFVEGARQSEFEVATAVHRKR